MSKRRRSSGSGAAKFIQFLLMLVILGIVIVIFKMTVWNSLKTKATNYVASQAIEQIAASAGVDVDSKEVEAAINSMDEEDQETLNTIISEHLDSDTVSDITSYVANGDMDGAAQYAQDNLSEEDRSQLEGLYDKYLAGEYGSIDFNQQ